MNKNRIFEDEKKIKYSELLSAGKVSPRRKKDSKIA